MKQVTPKFSFELFPPKTSKLRKQSMICLDQLTCYSPDFISITYGAGGSSRDKSKDMIKVIQQNHKLAVAPHLTCAGISKTKTLNFAQNCWDKGIRQMVALRGDPPKNTDRFEAHPNGFKSSIDLIRGLGKVGFTNIKVGAYPEMHPDSKSMSSNIDWLKQKIDAGATSAITQFFFNAKVFLEFREKCMKAGVNIPIIPGILPIENYKKTKNMAERCGTTFPQHFNEQFAKINDENEENKLSIEISTKICDKLIKEGVQNFHFYTLNKPTLTSQIISALGFLKFSLNPGVKIAR
ncbi:MAG: methylenetetrahydrofolate reductase [NAD(P)H] [Rhodospirillales bacterium]|nr:methylenetetrahydrofolate reductase [NAD(P)H] [Rhodospirillales bacterium]